MLSNKAAVVDITKKPALGFGGWIVFYPKLLGLQSGKQ
jgi:hypothetical protein